MTIAHTEFNKDLGIATTVHDLGNKVVIQKAYDAQDILNACAEERALTTGQRWGGMRKVGTIPMAELATLMRQDGTIDNARALAWIKANPAFVTFDKVLK